MLLRWADGSGDGFSLFCRRIAHTMEARKEELFSYYVTRNQPCQQETVSSVPEGGVDLLSINTGNQVFSPSQ